MNLSIKLFSKIVYFFPLLLFVDAQMTTGVPYQSKPQVYDLVTEHQDQIVMLSNWAQGNRFTEYTGYGKSTPKYFSPNQTVWILCAGKSTINKIKKIERYETGLTIIELSKPICKSNPVLLSNYNFPQKSWQEIKPSAQEIKQIKSLLKLKNGIEISKIKTQDFGSFFLVFHPKMKSIYNTGGYYLLDEQLNQVYKFQGALLTPLIDLNNDGMPEFFSPSSDDLDAWIYQLYPKFDDQLSHYDKYIRSLRE